MDDEKEIHQTFVIVSATEIMSNKKLHARVVFFSFSVALYSINTMFEFRARLLNYAFFSSLATSSSLFVKSQHAHIYNQQRVLTHHYFHIGQGISIHLTLSSDISRMSPMKTRKKMMLSSFYC